MAGVAHVILAADSLPPAVLEIALHTSCRLSLAGPVNGMTEPKMRDHAALLVAGLSDEKSVDLAAAAAQCMNATWIGWNLCDENHVAISAYEAGAAAVLPAAVTPSAFVKTVHTVIVRAERNGTQGGDHRGSHVYRRGERIRISPDHVLIVRSGVVALTCTHDDGVEALTGLCGPGAVVLRAVDGLGLSAHTEASGDIRPWSECVAEPGFAELLRERLSEAEAWASIQAHPHLERRVLGFLQLLGNRFGVLHADGTLLDLDITHAQLAAAVGTTRATLSRQVGAMRRRGQLKTVWMDGNRRFILPSSSSEPLSSRRGE